MSRSGTLTYQIGNEIAQSGFGNSTIVGIGGDPIVGSSFIDIISLFEQDDETELIVMCGEIGGDEEERTADYIAEHVTKPVIAYIAGFTAPPGKTMGHAGAIVSGSKGTAQAKAEALEAKGVRVGRNPDRGRRAGRRDRRRAGMKRLVLLALAAAARRAAPSLPPRRTTRRRSHPQGRGRAAARHDAPARRARWASSGRKRPRLPSWAATTPASARLKAPLKGSVNYTRNNPRKVRDITITGGAEARGVGIGDRIRDIKDAYPKAKVDHSTDETFELTLVKIPRDGGGKLRFGVSTKTDKITLIGVPYIAFCE